MLLKRRVQVTKKEGTSYEKERATGLRCRPHYSIRASHWAAMLAIAGTEREKARATGRTEKGRYELQKK